MNTTPQVLHRYLISKTFTTCKRTMTSSNPSMRPVSSRPVQLVLDFDGTLTKRDTMHLVANAGYCRQAQSSETRNSRILPPWNDIVNAYMHDYSAHNASYTPTKEMRCTVKDELEWLDSLRPVEVASADRVNSAGILDDVTDEDMEKAASEALENRELELRTGWDRVLASTYISNRSKCQRYPSPPLISVLSVNWSKSFVRSTIVLSAKGLGLEDEKVAITEVVGGMEVYANEIPSIECNESEGSELRTNGDKAQQFLLLRENAQKMSQKPLCIYVGDSTTDLGCLLNADIGICIRDQPMRSGQQDLADTCSRLGISVCAVEELREKDIYSQPLRSYQTGTQQNRSKEKNLWYASDFEKIHLAIASLLDPA